MSKLACTWAEVTGDAAHAARCPVCTKRAALAGKLSAIATTGTDDAGSLPDAQRALARAMADTRPAAPIWRTYAAAIAAMTAVAAAGVIVSVSIQRSRGPSEVAVGSELRPEVPNVVAQAQVVPLPGADIVRTGDAAIRIHGGSVFVDVDPAAHRPFRVESPQFTVEVLGTAFTAREDGVQVERGTVRIVAPDGHELARVDAGHGWSLPGPVALR
jgi:ferric-dicitrate binding protein FerR (iron transport regulator)|nr:FecR family protein [Kofleriaceae bacterium]